METPTFSLHPAHVLLAAFLCSCSSSGAGEGSASAKASAASAKPATSAGAQGSSAAAASGSASAAPAPPAEPAWLVAFKAGTMKDPMGGGDLKLVELSLEKCYGFKGYTIKMPEGSTTETLVGARACAIYPPKQEKDKNGYAFIVMTDEIKVEFADKTKLTDVKSKPLDDPDAFLYEVERKGKSAYIGWVDRKVGKFKTQCNSFRKSAESPSFDLDTERTLIELCRTLSYTEPAKK